MAPSMFRPIAAALAVALCLPAFDAAAQANRPTPVELAQMPHFCYKQFGVPGADGPEYTIEGCGPGMNHYCGALMNLVRARGYQPSKGARLRLLNVAEQSIRYSQGWSKDYLNCPLKDHMAASLAEVQHMKKLYSGSSGASSTATK